MNRRLAIAFLRDDGAQGLAEYALIISLVVMISLVALRLLGTKAKNTLNDAANSLSD